MKIVFKIIYWLTIAITIFGMLSPFLFPDKPDMVALFAIGIVLWWAVPYIASKFDIELEK